MLPAGLIEKGGQRRPDREAEERDERDGNDFLRTILQAKIQKAATYSKLTRTTPHAVEFIHPESMRYCSTT